MNSNEDTSQKIGGRPEKNIWKHFIKGNEKTPGRYEATCKACAKYWTRGKLVVIEEHLANHCIYTESSVIREYLNITANRNKDDDNQKK